MRPKRFRETGWAILIASFLCAAATYYVESRSADIAIDDTVALGYTRTFQHQMGQLMGPSGEILTEWEQTLTSPLAEALEVAVCGALLAGYFFRVAWVLEEENRDRPS